MPQWCFFVKVFKQEVHARDFMRGDVFARPLPWFRELEDDQERGDEHEGAALMDSPDMRMTVIPYHPKTGRPMTPMHIQRHEIAGPLAMRSRGLDQFTLFCVYMKCVEMDDVRNVTDPNSDHARKLVEVPARLKEFGRYAVVIADVRTFMERVSAAAHRERRTLIHRKVEYFNPIVDAPLDITDINNIFRKRQRYDWQSEYRFAFRRQLYVATEIPLTLNVGDLGDVAYRVDIDDLGGTIGFR